MNLPEPEWFTIGSLAQRWGKDEDYIEQLIEDGKIQAKVKAGSGSFSSDPNEMREWERCIRLMPHPSRSYLPGGLSWPFGSKIIIPLAEIKRIEAPPPARDRHVITQSERGRKPKGYLRQAIEAFLDKMPGGTKAGFYDFVEWMMNGKPEPKIDKTFKDGENYHSVFKKVTRKGLSEGVYLRGEKEGRSPADLNDNHYGGAYIASEISKEKKRRQNRASLK